ncbi:MAG TPA: hypothetical protein VEX11_19105 [Acetobacteraceae bacterium]|jgi:hypothetical protein|nr:hypothetical protein [Acetobacteraceae bacterium]
MRSQALQHCLLGFVVVAALFWLDVLSLAVLRDAAVVLLGWAVFSTVLVASLGAWVAFGRRARTAARSRLDEQLAHQHLPHRH